MDLTDAVPQKLGQSSSKSSREERNVPKNSGGSYSFPVQESLSVQPSESSGIQTEIKEQQRMQSGVDGRAGDSGYYSSIASSSQSSMMSPEISLEGPSLYAGRDIDYENCYKMDHENRGKCLIINNTKFHPNTKMGERQGSNVDAKNMYRVFKALGFDIVLLHNQTTTQMLQRIIAISHEDHSKSDCFAMVILSHGDEGVVYGTDDRISLDSLFAPLKGNECKTLIGKPKLVFIQACRGNALDEGVDVPDAVPDDEKKKEEKTYRIPVEADFLYAYSSPPGYFSFRNNADGSWFIQALTKIFEEHGTRLEIIQLLTRVNRTVAQDFESKSRTPGHSKKKQIPSIVSMLTKELYFLKK